MSEAELLLALLCVLQGLYISYQWNRLNVLKRTLTFATYALEAAYIEITEGGKREEDTAS